MSDRAHIWRTSNLHCKTSVVWLMAQSILMSSTYCNDVFKLFSIVCSEPNAIMWHFLKDIVFVHYLLCMCSPYRYLASVGLAQACPNEHLLYIHAHRHNMLLMGTDK